ncbi:lipoprotein [Nitrosomonadaceae bacterium]|nr:lipoprotein [Nitrosomonadaceae bacterium]
MKRLNSFVLTVFLTAILLSGCDGKAKSEFLSTDITGANFGKDFRLADYSNKIRSLADFRGKVVVLFFGYTSCPDACPATMDKIAAAMEKLGKQADHVQVLFVTIDPERDTPALLEKYLSAFNPSFMGLSGEAQVIEEVVKEFKGIYRGQGENVVNEAIKSHSTRTYIFDAAGKLRLSVGSDKGVDVFTHDITELLSVVS